MNKASIGKRIRTCREEKGWSQEAFAEKIGLSIAYRFDRELSFYKRRFLRMDKHRKPLNVRWTARRDEKIKIKNKNSVSARVLRQKRCFLLCFVLPYQKNFFFQTLGVSAIIRGNISSLPKSISSERTTFENHEKHAKLLDAAP